jgi:DNA-binding NarL/FixJ family response regulator
MAGSFHPIPAALEKTLTVQNPELSQSVRILLADDHAMVRQGIRALLERHDDLLVVGEAWDGQHACELAEALEPDVIVMDANMPHLDGIEATHRIKRRHPHTVIIGLSVQSAAQVANSMLQAGASRYLTKETAGDQLYETIMAAVAHRGSSATDTVTGEHEPQHH